MGKSIRPFERGFFSCNNAITDYIMPRLGANAFKLLICALRQTEGWNKPQDTISYSQFMAKTGIRSSATIAKALTELLDNNFLLRFQVGTCQGTNKPIYAYRLNVDFELSTSEIEVATSETKEAAALKTKEAATLETEETTLQETTNIHVDADLLSSLLDQGVDKAQARKLIKAGLTVELLNSWLEYIENHNNLSNPVGFLVSRLKLGEYPPQEAKEDQGDTSRYLCQGSEFDGLILS